VYPFDQLGRDEALGDSGTWFAGQRRELALSAKTAALVLLASALAVAAVVTVTRAQAVNVSLRDLAQRELLIPVQGVSRAKLRDNYDEMRGSRKHEALDIMAVRGTPIVAVDAGRL